MTLAPTLESDAFAFLQEFVRARSAIVITEEKRYLVETRLAPVAQRAGLSGLDDLVRTLRRGDRALEGAVVDAMTTNETSWFRDNTPFEALREKILPDRIAANATRRRLSIWSAACSTGQEPYSVAMLIDTHFPELHSWTLEMLATDLSPSVLDKARAGRFTSLEINRGLPASHLLQYFTREGASFQLQEKIRSRVRFQQMNLAEAWPPIPAQDVILLRNVLIYFDATTKRKILKATRSALRPGGYLVLGTAETTRELVEGFVPVPAGRTTVYKLEEA